MWGNVPNLCREASAGHTLMPTVNGRLRGALVQRGVSVEDLARKCGCDPKTVGRWITTGRSPHPVNRRIACDMLGLGEDYLWPEVRQKEPYVRPLAELDEMVATYPDRSSVPRDAWLQLLNSAVRRVDMLVFSGTFLAQTNPRIADTLAEHAAYGTQVRLCFGQPDGSAVALRDAEEGIGGTLGAKVRSSLSYFTGLVGAMNCDVRLHDTTLYASLFRYDDQMLINPHILGRPSSWNPVLHVRRTGSDGIFEKYLTGFERAWEASVSWQPQSAKAETING